jgi:hypothetical protein
MTTATMNSVDSLGTLGANVAMKSAANYLHANKMTADVDALLECLRSWCKVQLPVALADAKEAADCGMNQIATATFSASMALAGIEAAKEAGFPIGFQR